LDSTGVNGISFQTEAVAKVTMIFVLPEDYTRSVNSQRILKNLDIKYVLTSARVFEIDEMVIH
jgi:uncharacterized membrane protein (UPF0127 family)